MSNQLQPPLYELLENQPVIDPVVLRRVFLVLVRQHFSNPRNFNTSDIKDMVYTNDEQSPLDIKLDYTYDSEDIGKKPVIYVGTGNFTFKNQVIDDYSGQNADGSILGNTAQCTTTIEIRHISMSADLCLALATQTLHLLGAAKYLITKELPDVLDYAVSTLTPPALIDPEKIKIFQSNLTLNIAFNMTWTTVIESLRIKNIVFRNKLDSPLLNDLDM
tara:strand:+ start:2865 stop:3518 length:654 start_codon:yes stop_codon:yes gene_type:complete